MINGDTSSSPPQQEIDLLQLAGVLLERWKLIVSVSVLSVMGAMGYVLVSPAVWQADVLIQVEKKQGGLLPGGMSTLLPELAAGTGTAPEIQLLQSRMVLGKTVRDLNLQTVITPAYIPVVGHLWAKLKGEEASTLSISVLNIPDGIPIQLTVNDARHYQIEKAGVFLEGKTGQLLDKDGFSILVSTINALPGSRFTLTHLTEQAAVRTLQKSMVVSEKGKDSGMLSVTMTGSNASELVSTLNQLAENYRQQNVSRLAEQEARSLAFLEQLLQQVRVQLNNAEVKLNTYRQQRDSVDLNLEAKSVLEQIVNVDNQLNALTFQEAEVSQLYKKEHPSYRALEDKQRALEKEKARLGQRISNMPSVQQEVLRLSREVESGRAVYMQLLSRQQELSITRSGITGNVRIIDNAIVHPDPVKPKKALIVLLGGLLGGLISCGGVLLHSTLRQRIESPEQLEALGVRVYATVPQSAWLDKRKRQFHRFRPGTAMDQKTGRLPFLAQDNPTDLSVEAIRSLRTSLNFDMMESSSNVLVITGTTANSGKTFVSSTLAVTMAQAGRKVLFIDADLRQGDAHTLFGIANTEGLSAVLTGKQPVQTVCHPFATGGFDVITRGGHMQDPTEWLMHERFSALMTWARTHYDVVIVDTPPALAVTDAAIIGRADCTMLLVTRAGMNSVKETTVCIKKLEREGVRITGVVLNGVIRRVMNFYRDGYRCEGYSYPAADK